VLSAENGGNSKGDLIYIGSSNTENDNGNPTFDKSLDYVYKWGDKFLTVKPHSVMEAHRAPASGDKHDFLSLAPYCWPNKETSTGYPYRCHDSWGVNPEILKVTDKEYMKDMITRVKTLSLAYHYSQNESYASKAADLIRVWFLNNDTKMNPNMQYSEAVPGKNNGTFHGIIGSKQLPEVLDSIKLFEKSGSWTSQDERGLKAWFTDYLDWLVNSTNGIREGKSKNNHGTWYDVQVLGISAYLNNTEVSEKVLDKWMNKLLKIQIQPNGTQPLEITRPTSLQYSIFNLLGIFKIATYAEELGVDFWNFETPGGSGIQKALDYILPYFNDYSSWPYEQKGPLKYDYIASLLCQAMVHYPENSEYETNFKSMNRSVVVSNIDNLFYGCLEN